MNILLTGGTGLIGSALIPLLLAKQHQLCVLTRQIQPLHFPKGVKKINDLAEFQQLNDFDAVINLAGEPIFDHRWTAKQKAELFTSRVNLTQNLTALINRSDNPPHTFISGSASGYYGDHQDHWIDENSPAGTAFPHNFASNGKLLLNKPTPAFVCYALVWCLALMVVHSPKC